MPTFLPFIGSIFLNFGSKAPPNPAELPFLQGRWEAWVGVCCLVAAGWVLRMIFSPSPRKNAEPSENDVERANSEIDAEKEAALREEIQADFDRVKAGLQGEVDAAKALVEQQRAEILRRDEKLALSQTQLEEKQRRLSELVTLTDAGSNQPGNRTALAHAQASVIQLSETIKSERQKIGSGISRLEQVESRVEELNNQVWAGVGEVEPLREKLSKEGGRRGRDLAKRLESLEEKMRVHHKSGTGCVQSAADIRSGLRKRQEQLRAILQPVSCVEKQLDQLLATPADDVEAQKEWGPKLESAANELEITRELVGSFQNGLQQEISEINGRVDWLTNDSATGFVNALNGLSEAKLPRKAALKTEFGEVEQKLIGLRTSVEHFSELLPQSDFVAKKGAPQRISTAVDTAIQSIQTAAIAPAIPTETSPMPELEGIEVEAMQSELEELRNQLSAEQTQAAELQNSLKETQSKLESFATGGEAGDRVAAEGAADLGRKPNFMRRLLGLGPDRREKAIAAAREAEENASEALKEMTQPQLSIAALQTVAATVETGPIVSEKANGHSDPSEVLALKDSLTKKEGEIEELKNEIKHLTVPIPEPPKSEEEPEVVEDLKQTLASREERIAELESEIKQLTAPIPLPSEVLGLSGKTEDTETPEIPAVTVLPLESPDRLADPESTGQESETEIPVPEIPVVASSSSDTKALVIFRGDDPKLWNSEAHDSNGNFARPLSEIPENIESVTLKRLDTGDSISVPVTKAELMAGTSRTGTRGWSGKAEQYFGSMHLGIYDETVEHQVETKFGAGGWGFGHRYEIGTGQAFAWEGREIDPVRFEISVQTDATETVSGGDEEALPEKESVLPKEGLIIFRSNNPELWNRTVYRAANQRARAIDDLPNHDAIKWLRLKRCDTGESVFVPTSRDQLNTAGGEGNSGFNGSNEHFYGAHHLGVFDLSCDLEVETKFTFGGWGFGHASDPTLGEVQACGWAGKTIDPQTVIEITVFDQLPETSAKDLVLQAS